MSHCYLRYLSSIATSAAPGRAHYEFAQRKNPLHSAPAMSARRNLIMLVNVIGISIVENVRLPINSPTETFFIVADDARQQKNSETQRGNRGDALLLRRYTTSRGPAPNATADTIGMCESLSPRDRLGVTSPSALAGQNQQRLMHNKKSN